MIINSLYGTGNINTQDRAAKDTDIPVKDSEIKKSDINKPAQFSLIADNAQNNPDNALTYEDELKAKQEEKRKQELLMGDEQTDEDKLESSSDRMTKDDYEDISEEGVSLEKYNLERLDRALQRIKTQRAANEENVEVQKEKLDEKTENVQKMAYTGIKDKIAKKLEESNLPVTDENIAKLSNTMELAAASSQISDKTKNYIIKNDLEPSIENIYKAQYSGGTSQSYKLSDDTLASLKGQMEDIIEKAGLELNTENTESAKWLLNQNLPLTEDNLWSLRNLNLIQENYSENDVLDKAVKAMVNGMSPESASLSFIETEQSLKAIDAFAGLTDEAVQLAVSQVQDGNITQINCRDLLNAQKQIDQGIKTGDKNKEQISSPLTEETTFLNNTDSEETDSVSTEETDSAGTEELDIKTITVRRQLEEIRLKMTLESGSQLIKKGFNLDTDSLSKIVDGLKDLENQYYNNLLKEGNAAATSDNVEVLKNSLLGVEELKGMPSYVLGSTLTNRKIETVNGLLTAGSEMKGSFEKANEAYETLMTKPRADMGDSIKKAFRNVDAILEDMNLETTQANERAVRILGYNGMEITEDNITQVKAYDEQVNRLMNNFHPAVAVELIKKGENPLNMSVEDLNQQIDDTKAEIGVTEEEQYSKYLWKLEKNKELTAEEKKSYIGIYRLLNQVQKTDGAAVGAVVKANQEVTMKNLLTAVRTMKNGGIDTEVDDNFGALNQLTFSRESITDQINSSFGGGESVSGDERTSDVLNTASNTSEAGNSLSDTDSIKDKVKYMDNLLKDIMDEVSPEKLTDLGNADTILNMSLEKLHEEVISGDIDSDMDQSYWNEKLEQFKDLAEGADSAVRYLNSFNIPTSLENIQAAKDVLNKDYSVFKQLKNLLTVSNTESETAAADTNNYAAMPEVDTETDSSLQIESISDKLLNALTGQESMEKEYKELEQDVNNLLNQYYENQTITSQDIATLQRINYGMSFIQKLAGKESYEIPLTVGDSVTNVNVTILRNTNENGKVSVDYDSQSLGKISVNLSVKDGSVNLLFTCDNRTGRDTLANEKDSLAEAVLNTGLEVKQLNYGIGNKISEINRYTSNSSVSGSSESSEEQNKVDTSKLYNLAKIVLIHMKQIEMSNQ